MALLESKYVEGVDFAGIALQDPDFAKVLKKNGQLDFSDPDTVQQLTKSLLKRDFGLQVSLPPDRLCPPVPNRLNYIIWIRNLLNTTSDSYSDRDDPDREVLGLDIGTGASCIYPLLGCAQCPKWTFAGTDIDEKSIQFARQNVQANSLQERIKLLQTKPDGPLLPLDAMELESVDFSMCNPPFYKSKDEMMMSAAAKKRPPFTACTGSESEMVTAGGETAFVSRMIEESLHLRDRVQWYTAMLGKSSSVATLVQTLRENKIDNYAVTEFVQGNKTRRWGVAWTFNDLRPRMSIARGINSLHKALLPFPSEYIVPIEATTPTQTGQILNGALSQLPLRWMWKPNILTGVGFSDSAVWSRAARRHLKANDAIPNKPARDAEEMALGLKIIVEAVSREGHVGSNVVIRWIKGHDSVLFESFCGMVKRKMEEFSH